MTRRALASWAGALVVIAWAVATAIAYARRERPVPAQYREDDVQPPDPYTIVLTDTVTGTVTGATDVKVWYFDAPRDLN